jgi:hypothetical protein
MDDVTTSGADTVDVDQAATPDPDAPWGRKADGTPYKRDPDVMRRVREQRFKRTRPGTPPRAASPARPSQKAGTAGTRKRDDRKYGTTVAKWFVRGSDMLLQDPVEKHIVRTQSVQLAVIVDRVLDEDPRLMVWIERLRLRLAGGAKGELLGWGATTGLLVAMNRGYKHPLLSMALGGVLETIQVDAVRYEQAQAEDRRKMAEMMEEIAREEARARAEYEAALAASMDAHPAGNARADVLGQFGGAG